MKRTNKSISLALSAAMLMSCMAAVAYADGTDTSDTNSKEQIVELKESSTFNRVVIDSAPDDIKIEYSNGNSEWTDITAAGNGMLINANDAYGFLYGRFGDGNASTSMHGKYAEYTADKIRISSESANVSELPVKVYYATDVAPTSATIKADNTCFTMKNGDISLYSKDILNGNRLNNPGGSNPAYIYGIAESDGPASGNGYADGKTDSDVTKYEYVDLTIKLTREASVSQISYGNIFDKIDGNDGTNGLGKKCEVSYKNNEDWCSLTSINSEKLKHVSVLTPASAPTDTINMNITFGTKTDSGRGPAFSTSYIGIYDFGPNLAKPSAYNTVSFGKDVTFNNLTTSAAGTSWEFLTADGWQSYTNNGTTVTASAVRVPNESGDENSSVPTFSLSWNGNLVEYAVQSYNGSSFNKNDGSKLYDDPEKEYLSFDATDNTGDFIFNFNGPAKVTAPVTTIFDNGCWYPVAYSVYASNTGDTWAIQAAQSYEFPLDSLGWHKRGKHHNEFGELVNGDSAEHTNTATGSVTLSNTDAAMLKIEYRGSMRKYCDDATNGNSNSTSKGIRVRDLKIPGTVSILSYDGNSVTFAAPSKDDPTAAAGVSVPSSELTPNVIEATAANTFVKNITDADNDDIRTNSKATAVLSTINVASGTAREITWQCSGHTGTYTANETGITNTEVVIGLIIDWGTGEIPAGLQGLEKDSKIANTVISTTIQ